MTTQNYQGGTVRQNENDAQSPEFIRIDNPASQAPTPTSSGAECVMTKKADVILSGHYANVGPDAGQVPKNPNGTQNEDTLSIVERPTLFGTQITNISTIYSMEGLPNHYAISNMPNFMIPPGLRADSPSNQGEVQGAKEAGYTTGKDHATILKQIGIECMKGGVSVAPVLSSDDIRAMSNTALGSPKGQPR